VLRRPTCRGVVDEHREWRVGDAAERDVVELPSGVAGSLIGSNSVWAGDATVELTLERPPAAAETRSLHTSERFGRETDYAGLVVRLVRLDPHPREGATIAPEDYRVTLVVDNKPANH
jgi:hypothetical protein